jgi:methionyl aminopeptidase
MNLFAELLASTRPATAPSPLVEAGPRIQKSRRGVEVKSAREIETMRQASRIVATVLREMQEMAAPGLTTGDLDAHAEKRIREMGATPSFKGYHGFPASICASINNEVVHGIPSSKRVIKAGDLLKVDTGAYFDGYHGDSCITICVGEETPEEARRLARVAQESLMSGLAQIKAGNTLLDIAGAVQDHVEAHGYAWTVVTVDGSLSAQWEHTIAVTSDGCEILTDRDF